MAIIWDRFEFRTIANGTLVTRYPTRHVERDMDELEYLLEDCEIVPANTGIYVFEKAKDAILQAITKPVHGIRETLDGVAAEVLDDCPEP